MELLRSEILLSHNFLFGLHKLINFMIKLNNKNVTDGFTLSTFYIQN